MQTQVPCSTNSWNPVLVGAELKHLGGGFSCCAVLYLVNPAVLVLDDVRVAEARHEGHLQSKHPFGFGSKLSEIARGVYE
jgi:hypothetical protein